jgi:protein TonB
LVVAAALHGLLLSLEGRGLKAEFRRKPRPLPVAVTLTYRPPAKPPAAEPPPQIVQQRVSVKAEKKPRAKTVSAAEPRSKTPQEPAVSRKNPPSEKAEQQPKVEAAKTARKAVRPSRKEHVPEPAAGKKAPAALPSSVPEPAPEQKPSMNTQDTAAEIFEEAFNFAAKPPADSPQETVAAPPGKPLRKAVPVYRQNPPPRYPAKARHRGWEGTVVLEVLVNRKGRVDDLRVLETSGHEVLDEAALKAVGDWLFEPGRRGAEKVAMWVKVPLRFELR